MGTPKLVRNNIVLKTVIVFLILSGGWFFADVFNGSSQVLAKSADEIMVPASFSRLAETVSPAVVNIRTVKTIKGGGPVFRHFQRDPWGRQGPFNDFFEKFFGENKQHEYKQPSLGSGFIIDREGYVVTNNHVIEDADQIKVKLGDDEQFDAVVVGRDSNTDLALLKIQSKKRFPVVEFGNSDELKVGQWVVAIGSPFGLERTVTAGIVSAKGRVIGSGPYDDFIQTDASINPGNSGGPLIDMAGKVVGINTAIIASGQGIGFAIPVNMAKDIIAQLKSQGEVTRGWLGVAIQDLTGQMAEYYGLKDRKGVLVADVFKEDPADAAGIQPKDIILEIDDHKVESSHELTALVAGLKVGDSAKIEIFRKGRKKTFTVKIGKRDDKRLASKQVPRQQPEEQLGLRVTDITPEMAQRFNLGETGGVIVTGVESGSKAAAAGVQVGDIIKEINHQSIESAGDYAAIVRKIKNGEAANLFIWRKNAGFLVVNLTK